jgi:hypothetical protein
MPPESSGQRSGEAARWAKQSENVALDASERRRDAAPETKVFPNDEFTESGIANLSGWGRFTTGENRETAALPGIDSANSQ